MSEGPIVEILNVTKSYSDGEVPAVNDLILSINKNETFGLLGPNGAGKTTTISMLCGLISPNSGVIKINGLDDVEFGDITEVVK